MPVFTLTTERVDEACERIAERERRRKMTHTPGPYHAEGGAIKAISHGLWFTVALVDKKRFTQEGREGNARLLAAAPELLEACSLIAAWDQSNGDVELLSNACSSARAAIAKAEGR